MTGASRTRLRRKLLCIGGVDVDFIDDPYIQMVSEAGAPFANVEIRIARGRPNECHRNAALFWLKGKCHAIAVGYYLGPDRVWRQHSWGAMEDGAILDTHRGGQQYFGVCLDDLRAVSFCEDHAGCGEVFRFMKRNPKRSRRIVEYARRILATPD